jgi:hypothetical protein
MKLQEKGDTSQNEKLSLFHETLRSPLFNQILTLQQSIKQLKGQVSLILGSALPFANQQRQKETDEGKLPIRTLSQQDHIGACVLWAALAWIVLTC